MTGSTNCGRHRGVRRHRDRTVDPDGDVTQVGDYSLDFHYQARALLSQWREHRDSGTITGRNDYAGGIVGRGYFGRVTQCQSYGGITADGSYVGGIAGSSDSGIAAGSWAKCTHVRQGLCGRHRRLRQDALSDCRSLVTVDRRALTPVLSREMWTRTAP